VGNVLSGKIEARSLTNFCREKAIIITCSEGVSVALIVQHAKRMRRIILSAMACLAVPHFSTLSHRQLDFRKIYWTKKSFFYFPHKFCLQYFSFKDELSEILPYVYTGIHLKYPLFLTDFNEK